MKDRLLYLRKDVLKLSRDKFGKLVGMSDSEIKNIENGITKLKENKIPLICSAYNVSETWLRTGEGSMFVPKSLYQEMGEIVQAASRVNPEKARKFFDYLLDGMTEADVLLMYQIFCRTFPDLIKNGTKKGQSEDCPDSE